MTQPVVNWLAYRKCSVCHAPSGDPCRSRSSAVVGGVPDGVRTDLDVPHVLRKMRATPIR